MMNNCRRCFDNFDMNMTHNYIWNTKALLKKRLWTAPRWMLLVGIDDSGKQMNN